MHWSIERKIKAGFMFAMATLALIGALSCLGTKGLITTLQWVVHTHTVIESLEGVLADIGRVESDARGYVISSLDTGFLKSRRRALRDLAPAMDQLTTLTADNPAQQRRLDALKPLIAAKMKWSERIIATRTSSGAVAAAALVKTGQGLRLMEATQALIREMEDAELALLRERSARAAADARMTLIVVLCGSAVAFGIVTCALFVIQRDLARRKRVEAALEESEARLQAILSNTDAAIYLKDLQGRFILVNRRVEEVLGRDRKDLIGRTTGDVLGSIAGEAIHAHDREALQSGKSLSFEENAPLADGMHTFLSVKCALRDADGVPYALCGVSTDITERKRAEIEMERLRSFLDSIVENIPNMVFVKDARDLRFERFNRAGEELLGFSRNELIGRNDHDLFPKDQADFFAAKDRAVLESGALLDIPEEAVRGRDGQLRFVHTKKVPIRDKDGCTRYLLGISEDITERKRSEEQIQRLNEHLQRHAEQLELANHELEAFSYSVSHDLRAPLRHIDGFTDLLRQHARSALDEKAQRYLNTISDSAKNMGALIDDLLVFSRMGRSEMQPTTVDLGSLVAEVRQGLGTASAGRKIEWQVAPLPKIQGDPAMLRLVLTNLLSNAIKYTGPRNVARIEIGSTESADEAVIFVRDNGVGFDKQYIHKLFGVFQRLHASDEFEGTGIGLANVRRIISRHGGRTWAEGEIDQGATIYFSLPRREPEIPEMREAA